MQKQKNEDVQNKYMELQLIIQQINELQQQHSSIQNQLFELNHLKESLNELNNLKEGTESFVPMGLNIFTKAKIQDTNELLVNVGSNVFVTKTIEETKTLINSQIDQVGLIIKEIQFRLNELENQGQLIQSQIISLNK